MSSSTLTTTSSYIIICLSRSYLVIVYQSIKHVIILIQCHIYLYIYFKLWNDKYVISEERAFDIKVLIWISTTMHMNEWIYVVGRNCNRFDISENADVGRADEINWIYLFLKNEKSPLMTEKSLYAVYAVHFY